VWQIGPYENGSSVLGENKETFGYWRTMFEGGRPRAGRPFFRLPSRAPDNHRLHRRVQAYPLGYVFRPPKLPLREPERYWRPSARPEVREPAPHRFRA
jgi:hypothetical protein